MIILKAGNLVRESVSGALIEAYPSIGLKPALFRTVPSIILLLLNRFLFINIIIAEHYWSDINNCRQFFEEYAMRNGFDPLIPGNWYSTTPFSVEKEKVIKMTTKVKLK